MRWRRRTAAAAISVAIVVVAGCSSSSPDTQKVPSLYGRSATTIAGLLLPACHTTTAVSPNGIGHLRPGKRSAVCMFSDGDLTVKTLDTPADREKAAASGDRLTTTCELVGPGFSIIGLGSLMLNHMAYTVTTVTYETTLHGFCSLRSAPPTVAGPHTS
jgi:hypothetical protein